MVAIIRTEIRPLGRERGVKGSDAVLCREEAERA